MSKKLAAEFVATFALLFFGAGAVCADAFTGGKLGLTGIALAHGFVICAMVYAFRDVSGAHINPAVSFAFFVTKKIGTAQLVSYVAAQLLGAASAVFLLSKFYPAFAKASPYLGLCNLPGSALPTFKFVYGVALEATLTFFLVMAYLSACKNGSSRMKSAIAAGLTVAFGMIMGGPLTGAAMNPARVFGPALMTGSWANHGVYWLGPVLGAGIAALLCNRFFNNSAACCASPNQGGAS